MTQIAFQRKMMDRGVDIIGHGSRAELHGRLLMPRAVQSTEVDWGIASRFARGS